MKGRYARRAHLACGCEWGGGRAAKYCPMWLRLREGLKVAREQRTNGPDHEAQYDAYFADFLAHCRPGVGGNR